MIEGKPGLLENPGIKVPVFFLNILSLIGLNIFISLTDYGQPKDAHANPLTVVKLD